MPDREMTPQEAIIVLDRLNTEERITVDRDELRAAVNVLKDAAQFRIKKKPNLKGVKTLPFSFWGGRIIQESFCPQCDSIAFKTIGDFCPKCGQALDWSET